MKTKTFQKVTRKKLPLPGRNLEQDQVHQPPADGQPGKEQMQWKYKFHSIHIILYIHHLVIKAHVTAVISICRK